MADVSLGQIVSDVRTNRRYGLHDDNLQGKVRGYFYWVLRTINIQPIIPSSHESAILLKTVELTRISVKEDYHDLYIEEGDVKRFRDTFSFGMGTYLEARPYVTKPQQALDVALKQMRESKEN